MQKHKCKNSLGFLFVLPALLGTIIFILIPICCSFILSFCEWDLLNEIRFIGFQNYKTVLSEHIFIKTLVNTLVYSFATTFFAVIIPLIIASVLATKLKFSECFKTIYFLPFITPAVVIAIVWAWVFDPNIGLANHILKTNLTWLYDENLALPVLIFISVWKLLGYNIVLYLTGFTTIDNSLYEAAKIDGANSIQILKFITIPALKPTIIFVTLVTAISSFQVFDLVYVMTEGGPNDATNVLVYSVYKYAFEYFDIGKSCAIAYILFFIVFILAVLQKRLTNTD